MKNLDREMTYMSMIVRLICSLFGFYLLHFVTRNVLLFIFKHRLTSIQCYVVSTKLIAMLQSLVVGKFIIRSYKTHDRQLISETYINLASAYYVYDLLVMYRGHVLLRGVRSLKEFWDSDTIAISHHIFMFIGIPVYLLIKPRYGMFLVVSLCIAEPGTLFYKSRGILDVIGMEYGVVYAINELLYLVSFFILRVCPIPILILRWCLEVPAWMTIKYDNSFSKFMSVCPHYDLSSFFLIFLLQCYWFKSILRKSDGVKQKPPTE